MTFKIRETDAERFKMTFGFTGTAGAATGAGAIAGAGTAGEIAMAAWIAGAGAMTKAALCAGVAGATANGARGGTGATGTCTPVNALLGAHFTSVLTCERGA